MPEGAALAALLTVAALLVWWLPAPRRKVVTPDTETQDETESEGDDDWFETESEVNGILSEQTVTIEETRANMTTTEVTASGIVSAGVHQRVQVIDFYNDEDTRNKVDVSAANGAKMKKAGDGGAQYAFDRLGYGGKAKSGSDTAATFVTGKPDATTHTSRNRRLECFVATSNTEYRRTTQRLPYAYGKR